MHQLTCDQLRVNIYLDPIALGAVATQLVTSTIQEAIDQKGSANIMLATGTSQFTFLEALQQQPIPWAKVAVFHLDGYIGLYPT